MLVVAFKPGHDGSVAVIDDHRLLYCVEAEKDSYKRYAQLHPMPLLDIAERLGAVPDVVALGGWREQGRMLHRSIGAGYDGVDAMSVSTSRFFGQSVRFFTSSHERSHILMALGLAPPTASPLRTVLVWEGDTGAFYLVDAGHTVIRTIEVMSQPGARYAFLFALADPTFADAGMLPRLGDAGKLMALAAYGDAKDAGPDTIATIDAIFEQPTMYPAPKAAFRSSPLYNAGVEAPLTKTAAALLTERVFDAFSAAAVRELPAGTPLHISGGCGLNCDWNSRWVELGHFSSVFVPPCANDSGSAVGTAIDAVTAFTGDPHIDWDVYSGLPFVHDAVPDPAVWRSRPLDDATLARGIAAGRVVAWVQGRWEMGPRALGNRSILAEPFAAATRVRLNTIKAREGYRPIAPCCRVEDLAAAFHEDFDDPYMLYFRHVRSARGLSAVTHVDGTARAQTVSDATNRPLHRLLTAFAAQRGLGVLCNTSLNFNGFGFINRMSDLAVYCQERGIDDMVVDGTWYQHL